MLTDATPFKQAHIRLQHLDAFQVYMQELSKVGVFCESESCLPEVVVKKEIKEIRLCVNCVTMENRLKQSRFRADNQAGGM